jgi:CopG-like RHH_1 or ribbon-helix-helix domain, RHH_5
MEIFEMPSRWRLTVNLTEETLKGMEEWAKYQKRTTSNLAAAILTSALEAYQQGVYTDPATTPPDFQQQDLSGEKFSGTGEDEEDA